MDGAWGNHGACISTGSQPEDMPIVDCGVEENDGFLEPNECPELCHNSCDNNSYCDCGTSTCHCKAGFTGDDCSIDLCAAARCASTGTCSARHLGYMLPVTSDKACICNDGWAGNSCNLNLCADVNCSGHGTCIVNGNIGVCECDPGYSGDECETSCNGICPGSYPYGCATSLPNKVKYGCLPGGGCHYLALGEEYPYDGFCTYKDESIPPTSAPTFPPTSAPTFPPTSAPTSTPTSAPTFTPTSTPTFAPTLEPTLSTTVSCVDSTITIAFSRGDYSLPCDFIERFGECLCANQDVSSHCPNTCSSCSVYACVDSTAEFYSQGNIVNCGLLRDLNEDRVDYFCGFPIVRNTCRGTCKICN